MRFPKRGNSGFTLIELMVALTILSILVGFAIPEVIHQIEQSKKQTQRQNQRTINKALQDFFADHGRYPSSLSEMTNATHPYFEDIPIDPITGRADWKVTNQYYFRRTDISETQKYFTYKTFISTVDKDPSVGGSTPGGPMGIYKVTARR
jgi:general secretion pathway protein G